MMKKMMGFVFLMTLVWTLAPSVWAEYEDKVPKNVLILDIKLGENSNLQFYLATMIYTVINLDTSELVILYYRPKGLEKVVHTGMRVNLEKQKAFLPFSASSVTLPRGEGE